MMSAKLETQLAKVREELALLKAEYEDFIYIVTHDLSAPLRQVEGFSEIISNKHSDSFDEKTKRHFELVHKGSTQASNVLEAIRHYLQVKTMPMHFTPLDINTIIADVKKNLSPLINEKNASVMCAKSPSVVGDLAQITQVFECLIHNALTYQSSGNRPDITISVIDIGTHWQFCVADNGIGIAKNIEEKIFKILRRGIANKKDGAMGMGLAIAKKIIQKHDGDIWVKLDNELGTCFYFTTVKDLLNV
jgi:light-regulated signal transduction histidine kinase (bacteriophytochrome)